MDKSIEAAAMVNSNWLDKQIADAKRHIQNMPLVMRKREGVIAKEGLYPGVEL